MTEFLAAYAAIVSTIALVWGIASWVLTGSRVRVELVSGATNGESTMILPFNEADWSDRSRERAKLGTIIYVIRVRNVGRLSVTIEGAAFRTRNGLSIGLPGNTETPLGGEVSFPLTLQPGASAEFSYRKVRIEKQIAKLVDQEPGAKGRVHAVVDLGSGKSPRSKHSLPLQADRPTAA